MRDTCPSLELIIGQSTSSNKIKRYMSIVLSSFINSSYQAKHSTKKKKKIFFNHYSVTLGM